MASRISPDDFSREPFRVFFPLGILAGLTGVALWPLHLLGMVEGYPGQVHARIMVGGFFGAFIFGFLGTSLPRLLAATPLRLRELLPLVLLHGAMVTSWALGEARIGDITWVVLLIAFAACVAMRFRSRRDLPPPGFILVGLAFVCAITGALLFLLRSDDEGGIFWIVLQRRLSWQGFILLPVLGISPFILPRLFCLPGRHSFPESPTPPEGWVREAVVATGVGAVIIGTFFAEAAGWVRLSHATRFITVLFYLHAQVPLHRVGPQKSVAAASVRLALMAILLGYLAVAVFPGYRVALLHLTLMGGFAVLTLTVATRVVFGHSGQMDRLLESNRWTWVAGGLMLTGMASRITGDFWPRILVSHYIYGAVLWMTGILVWAVVVLPGILVVDPEDSVSAPFN